MPYSADETRLELEFELNKFQEGAPSPSELNIIFKRANASYQSFLIGQPQQQQYGKAIPRIGLGQNDHIYQSLSPFITVSTLTIASGRVVLPTDFEAWVNMSTVADKDIPFYQKDKWNNRKNSTIDVVSVTNPIYTVDKDGFLFAPLTITSASLTYVATAPDFVWNFTLDDNQRPVYNSAGSVGLLWLKKDADQVIARALKMCAINLQNAALEQYAISLIDKGQ